MDNQYITQHMDISHKWTTNISQSTTIYYEKDCTTSKMVLGNWLWSRRKKLISFLTLIREIRF